MTLVAIGSGDRDEVATFARQLDLPFAILVDSDLKVIRAYELVESGSGNSVPAAFVVGADGVVRFRQVGKNYNDRVGTGELLHQLDLL